jgi:hypothetical protein
MADTPILLLPRDNYYLWVEAAKDYAAQFGAATTYDPDYAGRHAAPPHTITVAGAPNAFPALGDIRVWLRQHYPAARVDYVPCRTPDDLKAALAVRLAASRRLVAAPAPDGFRLSWPTDFARVLQGFGENPELYRRWNLPGHDGLDLFALHGGKVYACAAGTVAQVDRYRGDAAAQAYGHSLRLQHRDGFQTIYAHLNEVLVKPGDRVVEGQVLGLAGAAGKGGGDYLHLGLKKQGATAARATHFPNDIVDPTPYLVWPDPAFMPALPAAYPWPPGYCLVGVHGRADGRMQEADYPALSAGRAEAVKLMSTAAPEDVDRLRTFNSRIFLMVRLFASFDNRTVRPDEFVSWLAPDMNAFYQRGVRYFEIHNEPNLRPEGWTTSWNDGHEFGNWFIDVRTRLRQQFPQALLGYPGLSPGAGIPGLRMALTDFLDGSDEACRAADWVGLHCYWVSDQELNSAAGGLGYLEYRRRFPDKVLFLTEFSNVDPFVAKSIKGQQYARYYQHLRSLPGIGAAFSFVVSASSGFGGETWRNEDGSLTAIPAGVGARTDVATGTPPVPAA